MNRTTTGRHCPHCNAVETGIYRPRRSYDDNDSGWGNFETKHAETCADPAAAAIDCYRWDELKATGTPATCPRPFGPSRNGSPRCTSRSIASGGDRAYCTCDTCF